MSCRGGTSSCQDRVVDGGGELSATDGMAAGGGGGGGGGGCQG